MPTRHKEASPERPNKDLEILSHLGKGGEACVLKVKRHSDGKKLVLKRYTKRIGKDGRLSNETILLRSVLPYHPCILEYAGYRIKSNGKVEGLFEYCRGGDLWEYHEAQDPDYARSEIFVWHVFAQFAEALAFLRELPNAPLLYFSASSIIWTRVSPLSLTYV